MRNTRRLYPLADRTNTRGFIDTDKGTISAFCATYRRGRMGFAHECEIKNRVTGKSAYVHLNYINRTWEPFTYASVLREGLSAIGIEGKEADAWLNEVNPYNHH